MININKVNIRKYTDQNAKEVSEIIYNDIVNIFVNYYEWKLINDFTENSRTNNIIKRAREKWKLTFIAEYNEEVVWIIWLSWNQLRTFHTKYKKIWIWTQLFNHIKNVVIKSGWKEIYVHSLINSSHIYKKMWFKKIKDDFDYSDNSWIKYKIIIMKYTI